MKVVCIYHANCVDGFGAAFAVKTCMDKFGIAVEFHAANYGSTPPDVTGANVIIVDFSYKLDVLLLMKESAESILILDHHKSAQEDLLAVPEAPETFAKMTADHKFNAIFDMNRSGAGLAWDFFSNNAPRPALINHIEDRDLWRFDLEGTKNINAALFSYPFDFDLWASFDCAQLNEEGIHIRRKTAKEIKDLLLNVRDMAIAGYSVPSLNAPYYLVSELGDLMAKNEPFAVVYSDTQNSRIFSLRSEKGKGVDVSAIARLYGGGGHANAAAFKVPLKGIVFNEPYK